MIKGTPMLDKNLPLEEAVKCVRSGTSLALGGTTIYRRPMAFVRALIQRYKKEGEPHDLTLICFTAGPESDLLVGAGMVSRVRTCYFGLEIFGLAPMFTYYANRGLIEILEETEASLAFGLRAGIARIGFMPGRAWIGTDLPKLRPDVKTIQDPYSGELLMAFPAIRPDVAVIHALQSDTEGNAVIGNHKGADEELVMASELVMLTSEEIVPEMKRVDIVGPTIHSVSPAKGGALPTSCHPLYPLDGEALLAYSESVSDPATFSTYLDNWLSN
jgi:glutaconate CoA-transferase subunit A